MMKCLMAPASAPPRRALSSHPHIAGLIELYAQCKNLGALPDAGGLLDQRNDIYVFFGVFSAAEAEYLQSKMR